MARPIHSLSTAERAAAASEHVGKVCTIRYRRNKVTTDVQTTLARVVGACYNLTNGNSTGDLIVAPVGTDQVYRIAGPFGDAQYEVVAIALSNLLSVEPAE